MWNLQQRLPWGQNLHFQYFTNASIIFHGSYGKEQSSLCMSWEDRHAPRSVEGAWRPHRSTEALQPKAQCRRNGSARNVLRNMGCSNGKNCGNVEYKCDCGTLFSNCYFPIFFFFVVEEFSILNDVDAFMGWKGS